VLPLEWIIIDIELKLHLDLLLVQRMELWNLTIKVGSTTWNGSAWSNGIPAGSSSIILQDPPAGCRPNVNYPDVLAGSPARVTINSERILTVVNEVTVEASAVLISFFENNASLVQVNNSALNVEYTIQTSNKY
jgi:hypothetical protein